MENTPNFGFRAALKSTPDWDFWGLAEENFDSIPPIASSNRAPSVEYQPRNDYSSQLISLEMAPPLLRQELSGR
ncbi:MAG TPA: hypothetical protein DIW81_20235 [Planctomycetaceae bacterium]|nr:hypothetical protein [Rubinisphaera sp.]HCS53883.1 hypothetical protein [Planctomycetaceae bacterium]